MTEKFMRIRNLGKYAVKGEMVGEKSPNYRRKPSELQREVARKNFTGRKRSPEEIERRRISRIKWWAENKDSEVVKERNRKISQARRGKDYLSREQHIKNGILMRKLYAEKKLIPWAKGKDKNSDERLMNISKKNSATIKKMFAEGKIIQGSKGKKHTLKQNIITSIATKKGMANPELRSKLKKLAKERRKTQIFPKKDTTIEVKIQNFLKLLNIEFYAHHYIKEISHAYQCDILIPSTKTIIECDGDYWHGNPKRFPHLNRLQLEQIEKDKIRTKELQEKGFRVIRLWESEIKVMDAGMFKQSLHNI